MISKVTRLSTAPQCKHIRPALSAVVLLVFALPAAADMIWLEPQRFTAPVDSQVLVRVMKGTDFAGEPVPFDPQRFERFTYISESLERPLKPGIGGEVLVPVTNRNVHSILYESRPTRVTWNSAEEFDQALKADGWPGHLAVHDGESATRPVTELRHDCAKTLILPEGHSWVTWRSAGCVFELIPESIRARLKYVDAYFEKRPLRGATVVGFAKSEPELKDARVADRYGRAGIGLRASAAGPWLISAVHVVPAAPSSGADWETFRATLVIDHNVQGGLLPGPARSSPSESRK
jgi:hypothetical protein